MDEVSVSNTKNVAELKIETESESKAKQDSVVITELEQPTLEEIESWLEENLWM